ncbi:hypothetical protein AB3N04_04735 [Alkalihalophilus sp. As8PL]|uniref:Uncharacterized protein n=1 Tax=Alkalihalophilus sp. As8PL TaxID=3237103 RepID=A0AB39BVK1_9BACI
MNRNQVSILLFIGAFVAVVMASASYIVSDLKLVESVMIACLSAVVGGVLGYYLFAR